MTDDRPTGAERIAAERARQIAVLGYSREHDAEHGGEQLARAALAYVHSARGYNRTARLAWPWAPEMFKPSTPARDLVRAGALIAAALDTLTDDPQGDRDD